MSNSLRGLMWAFGFLTLSPLHSLYYISIPCITLQKPQAKTPHRAWLGHYRIELLIFMQPHQCLSESRIIADDADFADFKSLSRCDF